MFDLDFAPPSVQSCCGKWKISFFSSCLNIICWVIKTCNETNNSAFSFDHEIC